VNPVTAIPPATATLRIEPVVGWPRRMTCDTPYLLEVDLRLAEPPSWPFPQEEFGFSCMADGGRYLVVETMGATHLVLHRFGGTYGPVRFVLTARRAGEHAVWLTITTYRGAIVRVLRLPVRATADPQPPDSDDTLLSWPAGAAEPSPEPSSELLPYDQLFRHALIIELQPDGIDYDRYLLAVSRRRDGVVTDLVREDPTPRPLHETMVVVAELLAEAAHGPRAELGVEFLLPPHLLGLAVDRWWVGAEPGTELGAVHPVVVRSTSRPLGTLTRWRLKYDWLRTHDSDAGPPAVAVVGPDPGSAEALLAGLVLEVPPVCLVVDPAPAAGAPVLTAALLAGMPAVIWQRHGPGFAAALRRILARSHLLYLPHHVFLLRQEADRLGDPDHVGRHLTLLWDDPSTAPPAPPRLRAPARPERRDRDA
jgi:vWA-MoxR associated protein C-terminal domain